MSTTRIGSRFAQREVHGIDDAGTRETITIWIDWLPGAVWGVGRAVNLAYRENPLLARADEWIFNGFELADALEAANDALSSDLEVSRGDGLNEAIEPFTEDEVKKPLERWFFDHS